MPDFSDNNICKKCGQTLTSNMVFCPKCGEKVVLENKVQPEIGVIAENASILSKFKGLSKKIKALVIIAIVVLLIMVIYIISCEIHISKAKSLYAQHDYFSAAVELNTVPYLGREELYRIKAASTFHLSYRSYVKLRDKLCNNDKYNWVKKDDLEDCFWDTTFDLYLANKDIKKNEINDIELDEYNIFIDQYTEVLNSVYGITDGELNALISEYERLDDTRDMEEYALNWLNRNFFED